MKDLTGQRFHCLSVSSLSHVDTNGNAVWNCVCSCGRQTKAQTVQLRHGRKKSCGHLRQEFLKNRAGSGLALDDELTELGAWR